MTHSKVKTVVRITRFDAFEIDIYISSYLVYCTAGNIDMLSTTSTEVFFFIQKKEQYITAPTVDNEVSAVVRLTFYENLLIGQEKSVSCPY